jgi:ribosomal protein S18 acetylase RimI-like enzyme
MSTDEIDAYLDRAKADYVRQRVEFGGESETEAAAAADADFGELFPNGSPATGQYLYTGRDAAGERVGLLWITERERRGHAFAWIYDVQVDENRRRQGWGRALMSHAEQWARDRGLDAVTLNVFGGNTPARQLYRDLGYVEQAIQMSKSL